MNTQPRNINWDFLMKSGRSSKIEFWRDNGDGTCTRLFDGLTLTYEKYNWLPGRLGVLPWNRNNTRNVMN